ncbi:MAG: DUF393 domain-containing protein [Spirochaetales bacterium]|nr:DUF393 domain-containing protein [Spirochaetales bacterium]
MSSPKAADHPVVLFDGDCNLCTGSVQLLLRLDRSRRLRYASLQGQFARSMRTAATDAMLLWDQGTLYEGYAAVMRLGVILGLPGQALYRRARWPIFAFLGQRLYRLVARHRYRLLGRRKTCLVPDEALKSLFYD